MERNVPLWTAMCYSHMKVILYAVFKDLAADLIVVRTAHLLSVNFAGGLLDLDSDII